MKTRLPVQCVQTIECANGWMDGLMDDKYGMGEWVDGKHANLVSVCVCVNGLFGQ